MYVSAEEECACLSSYIKAFTEETVCQMSCVLLFCTYSVLINLNLNQKAGVFTYIHISF